MPFKFKVISYKVMFPKYKYLQIFKFVKFLNRRRTILKSRFYGNLISMTQFGFKAPYG